MRSLYLCLIVLIASCALAITATAAEFQQAERDIDFIKSSRRQDASLRSYFGDMMQAGAEFFHLGSFKATIHRDGLDRTLWLIPIKGLPYADKGEFRASARGNLHAIGVLVLTYRNADPEVTPGTLLLLYDGYRVYLKDIHEFTINDFKGTLINAPAEGLIDPVLGTVSGTAFSQANITQEGELQLYLQLTDAEGEPAMDEAGFVKLLLSVAVPGIATDDDSPYRELAIPEDEDEE